MVNLRGNAQNMNSGSGGLTPRMAVTGVSSPNLTLTQANSLDSNLQGEDHWSKTLGLSTLAAPVDVLDSMVAILPGVERKATNSAFWNAIGQPSMATWVDQNHGSVEVASGVLGGLTVAWGAEVAATKMVGSAWFAASGVGQLAARIVPSVAKAEQAANKAVELAALQGRTMGIFEGANRNLVFAKITEGGLKASVSEVAVIAALNQNSAVWSDDMTQNLIFAGLGVSMGAGLGLIQGRSMVNRWANSSEVKMANAAYSDPHGFERMADLALGKVVDNTAAMANVTPKYSTTITNMALNARAEGAVTSTRDAIAKGWEAETQRTVAVYGKRGTYGIVGGEIHGGSSESLALWEGLRADPAFIYGASSVAAIPKGKAIAEVLSERDRFVSALRVSANPKKKVSAAAIARANALQKETPLISINGSWVTTKEAEAFVGFQPGNMQFKSMAGTDELHFESVTGGKLSLREDGKLSTDWGNLDTHDVLNTVEAMNKQLDRMMAGKKTLTIGAADPHWSQLDMLIEYSKRGGTVNFVATKMTTIDELAVESLRQKSILLDSIGDLTLEHRIKLNLPTGTASERVSDPTGAQLKATAKLARNKGITMPELNKARADFNRRFDLLQNAKVDDSMDGGLFSFNRSKGAKTQGQWMNPIMGFFDDTPVSTWTKFNLGEDIAQRTGGKLNHMKTQKRAPLVAGLTGMITQNPELIRKLGNVAELADSQTGGTRNAVSATLGQFLTKEHLNRNSEMLLAAQMVRRTVNRVVENVIDKALVKLTPLVDAASSTSGTKSRVLLNQYASHQAGWDLGKAELGVDGYYRFPLDKKSPMNAERLGRPVEPDEYLTAPNGKEIVLDELSNSLRLGLEAETTQIRKEQNVLREAMGQDAIPHRDNYVPPQSTAGKFVGFTLDNNNKTVPGKGIVASSKEEYASIAAKMEKNLKPGERILTSEQIKSTVDMYDQMGMDWIDPVRFAKPNKAVRGALSGSTINGHALEDWLAYVKHGYEQVGSGTIRSIFDPQIRAARVHSTAQINTKTGRISATTPRNIFETFNNTLLGIPSSADPRGLNSVFMKIDENLDSWLAGSRAGEIGRYTSDVLNMVGDASGINKIRGKVTFEGLADALGPHTPFASATEWLEYQHGIVPPWKTKEMATHVNRVASGVILRWLELPHALMNVAGVITNMPSVIGNERVPGIGTVKGVNVPDTMKIMALGMKRMHDPASKADWAFMELMGDASQDVAELHHQTSMMNGKSGFMRVLEGDPRYANWRSMTDGPAKRKAMLRFKGIEGMASIVTDSSENWSRQVSHFIGLQLADYNGITGMSARHNFAREIANAGIANYDPLNRPEIYQSAFGSMYGLFTSYSMNWYQRMFRHLEDKQYAAFGRGMAMQASLFGMMGVPGIRQVADLLGGEEDGDGLLDGIYKRYGSAAGSVIANGGLNQITNILSLGHLPAMSINSRGDMNVRHPAIDFAASGQIPLPAGVGVIADMATGAFQVAGQMMDKMTNSNSTVTTRLMAETIARNLPNRAMKGALAVMLTGGQEADAYGNMMAETQSDFESALRMVGLRSSRQQAEIEAYFMNQKAKDIDAQRRSQLNVNTRALIRDKKFDQLPGVFEGYLASGGQPFNYPAWIKTAIRDAQSTRTENQLLQTLRSPAHRQLATRIQMYTQP